MARADFQILLAERGAVALWTRRVRRYLPGRLLDASTLSRIKHGSRKANLAVALAFERATHGQIRAEDLPLSSRSRAVLREMRQQQPSSAA